MPNTLIRLAATVALLTLGGACTARRPPGNPTPPLLTSLQATTAGDSAYFLLQVTNQGDSPVVLEPPTDPPFYFTVSRDGVPLWNSASELVRGKQPAADTLQAGETRGYRASWRVPMGLRGTVTVTGVLQDRQGPLVQSTRFRVP